MALTSNDRFSWAVYIIILILLVPVGMAIASFIKSTLKFKVILGLAVIGALLLICIAADRYIGKYMTDAVLVSVTVYAVIGALSVLSLKILSLETTLKQYASIDVIIKVISALIIVYNAIVFVNPKIHHKL